MQRVRICHLVKGPWPLFALCLGVCLLLLYVLVQGGQQHLQPGSGELDKLRVEAAKLRVEVTGLREKTAKLRDEAAKLRDEAAKLRDEAAKLREQMSAQNEMNKKLQDQNRDLQSKIDKMQGDLHVCRTESGKHGELVQGLKRSLENNEGQNSNLRKEISAQNEMIKKLQDQDRDLQSKTDKMQGDLHVCRNASVKDGELVQGLKRSLENNEGQNSNLQEEMSAQNEMIEKLQDQNRALQSKIGKMQGDHRELVQELKHNLGDYESQNSNLRNSLDNCWSRSFKSQDYNIWWLIIPLVLGCLLGCCVSWWNK